MFLFEKVAPLQTYLNGCRLDGEQIGFVPTMGALHEGHLSLIRQSQVENDITVCSIFVNPTQFNEAGDLEKYPRTPEKDARMLYSVGLEVLFRPGEADVYPPGADLTVTLDLGSLDKVMEGEFRPGHFRGVATVVKRLLDIVQPHRLYMGQKDYQQFTIIQHMIEQLGLPVALVSCPIVREEDGLAMSSRNRRLTPEDRRRAPVLFHALEFAREQFRARPPEEVEELAVQQIRQAGLRPEYFEIVDGYTLEPLERMASTDKVVACAAAWAGEVRLIDNVILQEPETE